MNSLSPQRLTKGKGMPMTSLNNLRVHSFITNSASFPLYIHRKDAHNFHINSKPCFLSSKRQKKVIRIGGVSQGTKAVLASSSGNTSTNTKSTYVKAIVTVEKSGCTLLKNLSIGGLDLEGIVGNTTLCHDCVILGKTLVLQLVSNELDPKTKSEKKTAKANVHKTHQKENMVEYEATFEVPADFGNVGAALVENEHQNELFLKSIVLDGFSEGPVHLTCDSWIQPKHHSPVQRVFFTDKSYLPSQTPNGMRRLREWELMQLRGDGIGERKSSDRIYDYDVYNDLGNPDSNIDLKRPVLGGNKQYPYPRRCRTGRKHSDADPSSEKKSSNFYVPRDEAFTAVKNTQFLSSAISLLFQSLDGLSTDRFPSYEDIDMLYKDGFQLPPVKDNGSVLTLLQRVCKIFKFPNGEPNILRFDDPAAFKRDKFFWLSDKEFARETLAGVNPYSIQLVKEWPLRSKLEPQIYGQPESDITKELIEPQINGYDTVEEAIKEKKLFMLDYHDLLLPYVSKVRQIEGRTLYGSRTIFFLTNQGTLKPLAIELTRPLMDSKPQWKQVFTPCSNSTNLWLWRLAKAHVLAHDSGYHELISHWLRTHCAIEPCVIATHRQLSAMHPIYRLLHPHLRYTMKINSLAREVLISANGVIECSFSTNKYSMELSSVAYDQLWRFDLQALPKSCSQALSILYCRDA